MTKLSVNINKFATLRNARGGNNPDILKTVEDCERFGAQGITIHPRPDQRHIRYRDAIALKSLITTEFNIEGRPEKEFIDLVIKIKPTQVTLVPDAPNAVTSNAGWDTIKNYEFLKEVIQEFKKHKIRVSVFVDPICSMVEGAKKVDADRVELYTEGYAAAYSKDKHKALHPYCKAAETAEKIGLGLNAGHDLSLQNISYIKEKIPNLLEVSIGHALVCEALYLGLENTIQQYLRKLN